MANTGFVISSSAVGISFVTANHFIPIGGTVADNTTETDIQTVIRDPGTFHNLFVFISSNVGSSVAFKFRNNATTKNQVVSPGGAAGAFQDTTNNDVVIAADKVDYIITGAPNTTVEILSILFDSTTNFSTRQETTTSTAYTSGNDFNGINGFMAIASSEPGILTQMFKAATFIHMQATTTANAKTATMTVVSRKNSAAGAISVTVATVAGINEDTTHSDVMNGTTDTWDSEFVAGTDTTHAATFSLIAQDCETSSGNIFLVQAGADADVAGTASATRFACLGGRFSFTATEANTQSQALAAFTYTNMSTNQTVASTNTGTMRFRKNTGNGNQTLTFGTAAGTYNDSTHSDAVVAADNINYSFACGATIAGSFSKGYVYGNFATLLGFSRAMNVTPSLTTTSYPGTAGTGSPVYG